MTHCGRGEIDQSFGHACRVHQIGGQQEEWNRQQKKRVEGVVGAINDGEEGDVVGEQDHWYTRETERKGDGDAQENQSEKESEENEGGDQRIHD